MVISIEKAEYIGEYKIQFLFNDGKKNVIDFRNFIETAMNPMTTQFLQIEKFKSFKIEYGDIIWGDYEMCFPIWDIYQGQI